MRIVDDFNGAAKLTIELHETPVGSKTYGDFVGGRSISGMKTSPFVARDNDHRGAPWILDHSLCGHEA